MTKPATARTSRKNTTAPKSGDQQAYYSADMLASSRDNNIGILIKLVQGSLNRMIDQRVSPLGLTAMQWRPLVIIHHLGVNTPAELSRHSHVDTGAMTRTLDRLEAKSFITRQRSPDDRRVVIIELTESGLQVARQILPIIAASLNDHLHGFSKTEIQNLISGLQRMLVNGNIPVDTQALPEQS
ncbi:MarR family transcriptional regulator [Alcaligenaceae bacterium]|nr:MarR family transcriptional regulator [Alcaligenaceae bacterium]